MSRGVSIIEARIAETANGWRLDRALADALPTLSRERLKALISSGQVAGPEGLARDPAKKAAAKRATPKPAAPAPSAPSWAMPEPAAPSSSYGHTDHTTDHAHGSGSGGENN